MSKSLQERPPQLMVNDDFSDFTVVVKYKKYRCHRSILTECSGFFAGLLRSEMRENIEGRTELKGITSDTFDIIMNSVYRGIDGLTEENVVSVWEAAHLLQIDYLVTKCEDCVMRTMSLENYLEYFDCAKLLQSEKVLKLVYDFMINHFNHFKLTETFLELTADELYMMVKSHRLSIASEELVVKSILRWFLVQKIPAKEGNDDQTESRFMELCRILSVARLCLLRPGYLQVLIKNRISSDNREVTTLLRTVQAYHQKIHWHWPFSVLHRICGDMTHSVVYIDSDRKVCKLYSLDNGSTHVLCKLPDETNDIKVRLAISDQMLILGQSSLAEWKIESRISVWMNSYGWTTDTGLIRMKLDKLICHDRKVYVVCRNSDNSGKNYPDCRGKIMFDTIESEYPIHAAVSYNQYILLFTEVDSSTAVLCYHSPTHKIRRIKNVDNLSYNIISFHCEKNVYILEPNGNLYLVTDLHDDENDNFTLFQFVARLWEITFYCRPCGAVVYKGELFIFGNRTVDNGMRVTSVAGSSDFNIVKIIHIECFSECHPMIVPKSWLK